MSVRIVTVVLHHAIRSVVASAESHQLEQPEFSIASIGLTRGTRFSMTYRTDSE